MSGSSSEREAAEEEAKRRDRLREAEQQGRETLERAEELEREGEELDRSRPQRDE